MLEDMSKDALFYNYYTQWIEVYKKDAIREATMAKYRMTQKWVEKLAPELKVCELTRTAYQKILNDYAKEHERQTTLDFHHQLKGAVMDAVDEGLIERDPTRKAIIKGKTPREKKIKYLNQFELHTLIADLDIKEEPKVADIMSHLINEIELDESRFKGKSILNIVENMKHECIEQVVSNFCLLWHADKDDVMYAATHYRNGIIPNESAIKASINYPEYKNTVEHALPKFKYYAKFFAELRSTLDDEIKPLV